MLTILSAKDTSNFLLRCLRFGFFFLSAQDFKFINLLADLLPQWRTLTLDVHEGKEADAGESRCREFGDAADISKQKCWKLNSKLLEEETVVWTARAVEDF